MIWIAKRLAVALTLVWIVATIVFLAIQMVPGDPAEILLSQGGVAPDPAIVEELRTQLGLDRPVLEQYRDSMWSLLHGDLGVSLIDGSPLWTYGWRVPLMIPRGTHHVVSWRPGASGCPRCRCRSPARPAHPHWWNR